MDNLGGKWMKWIKNGRKISFLSHCLQNDLLRLKLAFQVHDERKQE